MADNSYYALIQRYFPRDQWDNAYRVMMAESTGNPRAHNTRGEDSRGLFQINVVPAAHPNLARYDLFEPEENVRQAAKIYQASGWQPWTTAVAMGLNQGGKVQAAPVRGEPMDEDDDNWDMIAAGEGEPTDDQYDYRPPDEPGRNGTTSGGTGRKPPTPPTGSDYDDLIRYYTELQDYYDGLIADVDAAVRADPNYPFVEPPDLKAQRATYMNSRNSARDKLEQARYAKAQAGQKTQMPPQIHTNPDGSQSIWDVNQGKYVPYAPAAAKPGQSPTVRDFPDGTMRQWNSGTGQWDVIGQKSTALTPSEQLAQLRYQDDKAAQALADQIASGRLSFDQATEDFFQGAENRRLLNQRQQMAGSMFGTANEQVLRGVPYATLPGRDTFPGFGAGEAAEQASRLLGAKFSPIQWNPIAFDPRGDAERILQGGYDLPEIPKTVGNYYPIPTGTRPAAMGNVAGPGETFGYVDPGALGNTPASSLPTYPTSPRIGAWNPGEPVPDTAGAGMPQTYPVPPMSMEEWEAQGAGVPQTYPVPETPEERARREQQEYLAGVGSY